MTVVIPEFVTALGNVKVAFVPAIADTAAPTVAEVTASGAVDISCFLPADWAGPTADQNKGSYRPFCSKQAYDQLGQVSRGMSDLTYTYLPQGDSTDPGNKAYTNLSEGASGFLVFRYGIDAGTAFAAADKVKILPVKMGAQNFPVTGSDEFAPLVVTQGVGVTGPMVNDAVIAA